MFSSISLQDPDKWNMDTDATDHVHTNVGVVDSICNNHNFHRILVGDMSKILVKLDMHLFQSKTYIADYI